MCSGHEPENVAILRTRAVNLLRLSSLDSITREIRAVAHHLHRLFSFFQQTSLGLKRGSSTHSPSKNDVEILASCKSTKI